MAGQRIVGDYVLTQQLGMGSFAVVWKGKHTRTGAEVAIKEIATEKLTSKLYENLKSEINILKNINHPNIVRLFDTISASNRIFLVLEFCGGGDLAGYIQHHGRIPEDIARHFMRQLGAGLQVLQANNLMHRDLKPQNLLLSSHDGNAELKIADFGFARSLQPQGMAETLCGSPLYMAPEILQSKRYNAKADLWSVGTILYQLVTGQPPFMGQNPFQLLQNIQKSTDLQFPKLAYKELHSDCIDLCCKLLRKDPVERLSFQEFFTHRFIAEPVRHEPICYSLEENLSSSGETRSFQDESMPFLLDVDPPFNSASPSIANITHQVSPIRLSRGSKEKGASQSSSEKKAISLREKDGSSLTNRVYGSNFKPNKAFGKEGLPPQAADDQSGISTSHSKGVMMDSMEVLEKEYVLVSVPITSTDAISFSASEQFTCVGHQLANPQKAVIVNAALPKAGSFGVAGGKEDLEPSHGSSDAALSQADCLTRLYVLQKCAETIADLAHIKSTAGQYLEAFSMQLVCLAVWKEALSFSSRKTDGSSRSDMHATAGSDSYKLPLTFLDIPENDYGVETLCSQIEQKFCAAVEQAEALAPHLQALDGNTAIPDAVEAIFQEALMMGKDAAVDELMGSLSNAATAYTKAATLLYFLLVEAVSLPITPRLVLDRSDKQRLRHYIDIIASRLNVCAVHKIKLLH